MLFSFVWLQLHVEGFGFFSFFLIAEVSGYNFFLVVLVVVERLWSVVAVLSGLCSSALVERTGLSRFFKSPN